MNRLHVQIGMPVQITDDEVEEMWSRADDMAFLAREEPEGWLVKYVRQHRRIGQIFKAIADRSHSPMNTDSGN